MKWLVSLAVLLALFGTAQARPPQPSGDDYYRSSDGQMVHRPSHDGHTYGKVTAICGDGSQSYSHHHQGTCSHHGGVQEWENDPG